MPTRIEVIQRFLSNVTHRDLAALYNPDMEVQVNVAQDDGVRIEGEYKGRGWNAWTDHITTWKPFRIPWDARTENCSYTDSELRFDLAEHAEGIGLTGWDWKNKLSRWVAFDFDSITDHKVGLTDLQMNQVLEAVEDIPWVTIRKSTSGKGIHLYVFTTPTTTKTHTEHAALGRAILGHMSALTGFDFQSKVDACGGNMWVWHRKMDSLTRPIERVEGLRLMKQGVQLEELPPNWRDHILVVSGKRTRALPSFVDTEMDLHPNYEDEFEELCGRSLKTQLDPGHKKLIDWLAENGHYWEWNQDLWMLITHTAALKDAHTELGMRGIFGTTARGVDKGTDKNCFCFPLRQGSWAIRRYSQGIEETPGWSQDGAGWTRCYLNRDPDLSTAARANDGVEHPTGGFVFSECEMAKQAVQLLGGSFSTPLYMINRQTKIVPSKDGRLVVQIDHEPKYDKPQDMLGWILERKVWKKILNVQTPVQAEPEVGNYDELVRHIVSEGNEDAGWVQRLHNEWVDEAVTNVKMALKALGFPAKELDNILGSQVIRCWKLVNQPFQPEYPGARQWNRHAAQLRYQPSEYTDNLSFPTWTKILKQCGAGLTEAIQDNPWCQHNGIKDGGDYLKIWVASMFQKPLASLPYLFFWSKEQGTGKSTFHESISELMVRGHKRANFALTSPQGFNGELANIVFCVVEELNLGLKNMTAYNRIKDWVTSAEFPVHIKGETPYHVPNCTHWVHCANDPDACPIFPGDTRITVIEVPPMDPNSMIPRDQLDTLLKKEAPDFLAEVMNLQLPKSPDRLAVPVVRSASKSQLEKQNQDEVEEFLDSEVIFKVHGGKESVSDLYHAFLDWLDPSERLNWTQRKFTLKFPKSGEYPKGRLAAANGNYYIGNLSLTEMKPTTKIVAVDRKTYVALVSVDENGYAEHPSIEHRTEAEIEAEMFPEEE